MKILIVNAYLQKGGASRAARRLEQCLRGAGLEVDYFAIIDGKLFPGGVLKKVKLVANRLPGYLLSKGRSFFSTPVINSNKAVDYINRSDADIVHLHWVNSGALSISDIAKISKPIVWSLHDMWPFTGGCHYSNGCENFKLSCQPRCGELSGRVGGLLSGRFLNSKMSAYASLNQSMTMVGLSRWMADNASESYLATCYDVVNIPNPIDASYFKPVDKIFARRSLSIPNGKSIILFGALSLKDTRKGSSQLLEALSCLDKDKVCLVVFGGGDTAVFADIGFDVINLGNISDDNKLRLAYSAADVSVLPSIEENLSNMVMESLSCGVPVVAFDIGGNSDMIDHRVNGYLAKPYSTQDLAAGIEWVLSNPLASQMSLDSRKKVISEFNNPVVAVRYISLYDKILRKQ